MQPQAACGLEDLFGVRGMTAGRRVRMRPWMALFASDIPAREQVMIGLKFAALGLAPPLLYGLFLLALSWAP